MKTINRRDAEHVRWFVAPVRLALTVLTGAMLALSAGAQDPAGQGAADAKGDPWPAQWPREFKTDSREFTIFQPQLDSWDGATLEARAAVGVRDLDGKKPTYGVVWFDAKTQVDRIERIVTLEDASAKRVQFPADEADAAAIEQELQQHLGGVTETMALDELQEQLKIMDAVQRGSALEVKNDPPRFLFSEVPAILVHVGGDPVWRAIPDTGFERVLNTTVLLVRDGQGAVYLHVFDGWMSAKSVDGPWSVASKPPQGLAAVLEHLGQDSHIDLLEGSNPAAGADGKAPSLRSGTPPVVHVATSPTELIVFDGKPDYVPIPQTDLLFAKNTTGDVFMNTDSSEVFVLATGRWFKASSLDGPWTFVPSKSLPNQFAAIPDDSPKENVKAAVPGTEQASEAVIANSIPQTAKVNAAELKAEQPVFDGEPKLAAIDGTKLQYVVNTATPVIRVPDGTCYCVEKGVWFTAPGTGGPWAVATSVPAVVYTIPPSSPLHYVTYVYVYGASGDDVYVGYTPGYYGTLVTDGVVVFGTGYVYRPWIGTYYYPLPPTYGYAANPTYTAIAGWTIGFGMGWAFGAASCGYYWGPYPYWGPYYGCRYPAGVAWGPRGGAAVWGPGGWAGTTGNIYHQWGNTTAVTRRSGGYDAWTGTGWRTESGRAYNSRTGTMAAGQRGVVANAYTGNWAKGSHGIVTNPTTGRTIAAGHGAAGNAGGKTASGSYVRTNDGGVAHVSGGDVYATHDGNVYQRTGRGDWNKYDDGGWQPVDTSGWQNRAENAASNRAGGLTNSAGAGRELGGGLFGGFRRQPDSSEGAGSLRRDFGARFGGDTVTNGFRNSGGWSHEDFGGNRWGGHAFGGRGLRR